MEPRRLEDGLIAAHRRLLEGYADWGGHCFFGWTDYDEARNHHGTVILSEGDCVHRFALELEREFPLQVHCQFKLNRATRADFDESSRQLVRSMTYDAFVEVKWVPKGWLGSRWEFDGRGRVKQVQHDLDRLAEHVAERRCRVAAILIVQDEDFFDVHRSGVSWPSTVQPLMVGPTALDEAGLANG